MLLDRPFPNACFTCANFRTNINFLGVLTTELAETERLLNIAQANNWTRQIEMNQRVKTNLQTIIAALEGGCHGAPKKC